MRYAAAAGLVQLYTDEVASRSTPALGGSARDGALSRTSALLGSARDRVTNKPRADLGSGRSNIVWAAMIDARSIEHDTRVLPAFKVSVV